MVINPAFSTLLIYLYALLFVYLCWREFKGEFNFKKIFDFSLLVLFFGFIFDRIFFYLLNRLSLSELSWSLVPEYFNKPIIFFDFSALTGMSFSLFLLGAIFGIMIYNFINSIYSFERIHSDRLFKLLLPVSFLGRVVVMLGKGWSTADSTTIGLITANLFLVILFFALAERFKSYWRENPGKFTGALLTIFAVFEILENYLQPFHNPEILRLFDVEQLFAIILVIIGVNISLSSITEKQEQERRQKETRKVAPARGFAISFANKRRVSSPLEINFRRFAKTKNKLRRHKPQ